MLNANAFIMAGIDLDTYSILGSELKEKVLYSLMSILARSQVRQRQRLESMELTNFFLLQKIFSPENVTKVL